MPTVGIATGAGRGMGRACAHRLADMVDHLLLVDIDAATVADAAEVISGEDHRAAVEAVVLDVSDRPAMTGLAARVGELGTLRAVAHAAGISPTMADWQRIMTVDLVGTALVGEVLRPLATAGTALVCFASMAAVLGGSRATPEIDAALDEPLADGFLDRVHGVFGASIEDTGAAYSWAKRGVQRFVQREAVRLGPVRARICSVSPGIIDTPQGRQEAKVHPAMATFVQKTPLEREGEADEVAALVAFLLSDEASFINGVDILADGGVCAALNTSAELAV